MRFCHPTEWLIWLLVLFSASARAGDVRNTVSPMAGETALHREAPLLSHQVILGAIQADLARKGVAGGSSLQLRDLLIQSALPAFKPDVGLQVRKITYDPIRRETSFQLWAAKEPQYLPFSVTTRRDPADLGLTAWAGWRAGDRKEIKSAGSNKAAVAPAAILAKPGTVVTLVMLGQNVRITTAVEPLQPGIKGQRILVRDLDTKRILTAEVIDRGLLQTEF